MKRINSRNIVRSIKSVIQYILLGLYKVSYGLYIRKRYRVKLTPGSDTNIKGPYLLLANHCNNFDGFFLQCLLSRPIHFVVTDSIFKCRALGGLLNLVGYIPKRKFICDINSIRQILRTTGDGGVVSIFPEGARSWDGKTLHISKSTSKLIHMLQIPVMTAKIKGSYLSEPRWANTKRYGLIEVELKTLIDAHRLNRMSISQIEERINAELMHDESEWQRGKMIPFIGKGLAEGLERLLFTCPECGSLDTMVTTDDVIRCGVCNAQYYLDPYGYIHSKKGFLPTHNITDLNTWQIERLKLSLAALRSGEDVFLADDNACLFGAGDRNERFRIFEKGRLTLTLKQLIIGNSHFDIDDVHGVNIFFKSELTFMHRSTDYRISFGGRRVSVYKWYSALRLLQAK